MKRGISVTGHNAFLVDFLEWTVRKTNEIRCVRDTDDCQEPAVNVIILRMRSVLKCINNPVAVFLGAEIRHKPYPQVLPKNVVDYKVICLEFIITGRLFIFCYTDRSKSVNI